MAVNENVEYTTHHNFETTVVSSSIQPRNLTILPCWSTVTKEMPSSLPCSSRLWSQYIPGSLLRVGRTSVASFGLGYSCMALYTFSSEKGAGMWAYKQSYRITEKIYLRRPQSTPRVITPLSGGGTLLLHRVALFCTRITR